MLEIDCANRQSQHPVDPARLLAAARLVLTAEGVRDGSVSLAVVDDPTIQDLNRRYLQHDYPTDVLSFLLQWDEQRLDGEVIVSAETAAAASARFGWSVEDELLLYVIHGVLHLANYDDQTPADQTLMRDRERTYLAHFQLAPRYDEVE
jgi:probable rRNA maturation factor